MLRTVTPLVSALVVSLALTAAVATEKAKPADSVQAREIVAKFEKGDPGWKVRMTGLVELAKQGSGTVPVLVEALKNGLTPTREFAAQALVMFAEPGIRPALEQALDDPHDAVRIYAIKALTLLGPLPRTERHERMLLSDNSHWGVRPTMAAALEPGDRPKPAEMQKALADYDLGQMDTARVGETAPDFTLTDFTGKPVRLSDFRGKQAVVLRFILFDY